MCHLYLGTVYLSLNEYSGNTALGFAVLAGNIDITAMLLKAGADVNVENERGVTPLIISATKGYLDLTKFLVGNGANIDAKSKGIIPSGFYPQAPFLEKIQEKFGISAFAGACFSGYSDVAEYILEEHPEAAKRDGSLALQGAILGGHIDIVRWLLENKITPESVALPGHLLTSASANGYLGIVELLIDSGMNVNDTSSIKSHTPLTAASHLGHIEIVELLLSRGANKHLQTLGGITAYMLAKSEGHKKIMALLEDKAVEIPPLRAEDFELLDPACEGETECNGTYLEEKLVEYLDGGERREVPVVDVNEKSIPEMSVSRTGIVTDGISRLVLRVKTKQDVKFVLVPPGDSDRSSEYPWGALSEYNRDRQHPHSIEISHKEGEYTYGLYRAPANFPLKSLKKPVYITIKAIAKSTGEEIEKKIQLLPPPSCFGAWCLGRA
jgi:ankyrin repeat protein